MTDGQRADAEDQLSRDLRCARRPNPAGANLGAGLAEGTTVNEIARPFAMSVQAEPKHLKPSNGRD